ncbi:hypothetical protein VNO77_20486 [Canavalia gladiata]|uniref:Uncharacterized protein n=1 Tax=Canavalia gladiata TaxID=3824 RepID=A0AAN9QMH1_CANGL
MFQNKPLLVIERVKGFVTRPSLYVVWDDLKVTPMTTTSSISFLQELNVPLDDLEEHLVEVGNAQKALNLLGTSLTSKAVLTESIQPPEEAKGRNMFLEAVN